MAVERKEKLIRVLQILETTDAKSPVNAVQIVERLNREYNLEQVNRRSIYRDITLLENCGYRIKQCGDRKKGWYLEKHAFDDWEIKIMMDTIHQAKCVSSMDASNMYAKLLALTSNRGRSRFAHLINPKSMHYVEDAKVCESIETMLEAMYTGYKIEFQYTELLNNLKKVIKREGHIYQLSLYAIYWAGNNYYLIGAHDHHDGLTNYRLDRTVNLAISKEKEVPAEDKVGVNPELFIQDYIERSVLCFSGKEIRIEVEYEPNTTNNHILYDFAGSKVNVRELENGKCRASFRKSDTVTLVGWFMQYANRFQVIKPERLKEDVICELKRAVEGYGEG